jgi:hypothetical protein
MCRGLLTIENTEEDYEETSSIPDLMSDSKKTDIFQQVELFLTLIIYTLI